MKYQVKSLKLKIKYDKELYDTLREIMYHTYRIKNLATTMAYDWQQFSFGFNTKFGEFPKEKEMLKVTMANYIDQQIREIDEYKFINSTIRGGAIKEAVEFFRRKDVQQQLLSGERTLQRYKRNGSFPIRAQSINGLQKAKTSEYSAKLSLLSIEGKKLRERKSGQFEAVLLSSRKNSSAINAMLDRIVDNEQEHYKMSDSKIMYDERLKAFFLVMAVKFPRSEVVADNDKIMGVDLGIAIPAVVATNFDNYYYQNVGSAQEIRDFERQVEQRKIRLSKSRKWAGEGNVGHGYKKRTEASNKLRDKIARFKETKNHQWSKYIVDEAIKMGCGTIQMEDLSGISDGGEQFLKRWTYYDLQQKITYKAEGLGLKVVKVSPKYTSARCSKCGYIHIDEPKEQWRPSQDAFKCVKCEHGNKYYVNADKNASMNIATKDIEKIVEQFISEKKKLGIKMKKLQETVDSK